MDTPSGFRQPGQKRRGKGGGGTSSRPQLFEDTSSGQCMAPAQGYGMNYAQPQYGGSYGPPGGYGGPAGQHAQFPGQHAQFPGQHAQFPGQQLFQDPMMANMAMQYGSSLADQGKEYVNKNLEKYVAVSKLKYYFAVDTTYVGKKLALLAFPFTHSNWAVQYNQDEPIAPRYDINAPDLYIPIMAFVTYILVTGVVLGTQDRFTPEQLGIQASTALVWVIIELLATLLSLYILNLNTNLTYTDSLAYSGYKFVGMIFSLLAGLAFQRTGYYIALLWFGAALAFFLVRTLRQKVLPHAEHDGYAKGTKRSLYLIASVSLAQPVLMWWLTAYVMFGRRF